MTLLYLNKHLDSFYQFFPTTAPCHKGDILILLIRNRLSNTQPHVQD